MINYYLARNPVTVTVLLTFGIPVSTFVDTEQQPSPTPDTPLRLQPGTDNTIEAPDGITTVSVLRGSIEGLGGCTSTTDEGLEVTTVVEGNICCEAIASWSKQRTSSADAKSTGTWPS